MAIPKVKMQLLPDDLTAMLDVPASTELLSIFVTNDPLSITLIFASDTDFDELYFEDGGFFPGVSYKTVNKNFFSS
jgi:hypothetical protein